MIFEKAPLTMCFEVRWGGFCGGDLEIGCVRNNKAREAGLLDIKEVGCDLADT